MGCVYSRAAITRRLTSDREALAWTQLLLTDKEKKIITKTWQQIWENGIENGIMVFKYIFMYRSEVKQMFRFRDLDGPALQQNPFFIGHATHFMQAIGAVVDSLDNLDRLTPMLLVLGEQHSKTYGFGIQYFDLFTQCLLLVWEERLGDSFTVDVRAAWEKMFLFILMTLREGYNHSQNISSNGKE